MMLRPMSTPGALGQWPGAAFKDDSCPPSAFGGDVRLVDQQIIEIRRLAADESAVGVIDFSEDVVGWPTRCGPGTVINCRQPAPHTLGEFSIVCRANIYSNLMPRPFCCPWASNTCALGSGVSALLSGQTTTKRPAPDRRGRCSLSYILFFFLFSLIHYNWSDWR